MLADAPKEPPPPPRHRRKHLTIAEWTALRTAVATNLRSRALLLAIYEFGLRREEPGLLRLSYLEQLHQGRVYIFRQKKSLSGWVDGVSTGTQHALVRWLDDAYPCKERRARDNFVFPGGRPQGGAAPKGITGRTVYNIYRAAARDAALHPDLHHPHVLKASRAQHLLEHFTAKGADPWLALQSIAQIVGHSTAQTTIRHYLTQTEAEKVDVQSFTRRMTE